MCLTPSLVELMRHGSYPSHQAGRPL